MQHGKFVCDANTKPFLSFQVMRVDPTSNCLSLVYRDEQTSRFVKYLNQKLSEIFKVENYIFMLTQHFSHFLPIDLFTDSDTIMKDIMDIPAYIAAVKHLLISRVINIKGDI